MGELVNYECEGNTYKAYLAPSATGSGPGVIVIQEYWGLVGHIRKVADRFAEAGFTALAPDLYKGETAKEPEEAGRMMMALNISETEKVLRCAIQKLIENPACASKKAGVVGFCMGGQLSLFAAATNPDDIGACVDFYGIHPNVLPPYAQLKAPILGFFAENDHNTPREAVEQLDHQLTALGKTHEFKTYSGTDHAFFNEDRPEVYNPEAAAEAWRRMLSFFQENLA